MSKPTFDDFMAELRRETANNDPFWLVREFTRLTDAQLRAEVEAADEANARNERVDEILSRPLSFGRVCEG